MWPVFELRCFPDCLRFIVLDSIAYVPSLYSGVGRWLSTLVAAPQLKKRLKDVSGLFCLLEWI